MAKNGRAPSEGTAPSGVELGGNGLSKERVADIQRARMLSAMVEVVAERGFPNVTVAHVVTRSGVSRRTFYELFADRDGCLLAALDEAIACASAYVVPAYRSGGSWAEGTRLGLAALLSFLDIERNVGRLLVVESLGAGPVVLERRQRALAEMIAAVDAGRCEGKGASAPPALTAEGIVGAVLSVIHARITQGEPRPLLELLNPLMSMVVMPYLGPAAAHREIERPAPKPSAPERNAMGDPLRDLGMRLTYRTVCVLLSVAGTPGASNREIGLAAGIADQGQISKLLSRLEGLGLLQNSGLAPGKGAPNSWMLTERGVQVERAMSADAGARGQRAGGDAPHRSRR
ncbi:MAG: TetR/AcrR family transcriptional regulator [Solirubrobacteraceae bacterium]